jgi:hypothetical protein
MAYCGDELLDKGYGTAEKHSNADTKVNIVVLYKWICLK